MLWAEIMNPKMAFPLPDAASPILSARVAELMQFMGAPTLGRLTDEQRAISLAVTRRLVATVARRIDPQMDVDALWQNWLQEGIPATPELALACFARAEEFRWVSFDATKIPQDLAATEPPPAPIFADASELADAYLHLQVAERRRYDMSGYPALAIADISDDLYRHMLNEVARWRLKQISRDRPLSAGLGELVRIAWNRRAEEQSLMEAVRHYYDLLVAHNQLYGEANAAILRRDWPAFVSLAAVALGCSYVDMTLELLTAPSPQLHLRLQPLHLEAEAVAVLLSSLDHLSARSGLSAAGR